MKKPLHLRQAEMKQQMSNRKRPFRKARPVPIAFLEKLFAPENPGPDAPGLQSRKRLREKEIKDEPASHEPLSSNSLPWEHQEEDILRFIDSNWDKINAVANEKGASGLSEDEIKNIAVLAYLNVPALLFTKRRSRKGKKLFFDHFTDDLSTMQQDSFLERKSHQQRSGFDREDRKDLFEIFTNPYIPAELKGESH